MDGKLGNRWGVAETGMSESKISPKAGDYLEDHRQFFVDVAEAWDMEIMQRLAEVDSGAAECIDRDEFRRRIKAWVGNW